MIVWRRTTRTAPGSPGQIRTGCSKKAVENIFLRKGLPDNHCSERDKVNMSLCLVRHGQADSGAFNPDPSLTEEGRAAVDRMAHLASAFAIPVSQILHSSKIRARQTAAIMSHYLKP